MSGSILVTFTSRWCPTCTKRTQWLPKSGCVVCLAKTAPRNYKPPISTELQEIPYTRHTAQECCREEMVSVNKRLGSTPASKHLMFDGDIHNSESVAGIQMTPTERKVCATMAEPLQCGDKKVIMSARVFYMYPHKEHISH